MCDHLRKDMIQNDCIWENICDIYWGKDERKSVKVVRTHAKKALVRRVDCMIFNPLKRGRGRLRRTLKEIIIRGLRVIISLEIWFLTESNGIGSI